MILSWTTHQPICKDNLTRPLCIPGATSVLIAEPRPFKLSLRWSRDGATSGQWPTVQDLLSKCLGQTVDEVQYGDAVVLRSRVKIAHDEIVTFLDPRHAVRLGLTPSTAIRHLPTPCDGTCSLRDAAFRVSPSICDYFHWGGAQFGTCDTSFNQTRVVQLRCLPGAVLSVHGFDGNVVAAGPLVLLWSTRDIPAGFNLVADCCEFVTEAASSAHVPALDMTNANLPEPTEEVQAPLTTSPCSSHASSPHPSPPSSPSTLPLHDAPPSKKCKLDERGASTNTFAKPAPTHPLRNACASVRKWVLTPYSHVWYEWPQFPLATSHVCQGGVISQALKRTYALQFTLDRFQLLHPTTTPSATRTRIEAAQWTCTLRLRPSASIILPPQSHLDHWLNIEDADLTGTVLFPDMTSSQLEDLFPAHDTNWEEVIGASHIISMLAAAGSEPTLTSHEPAICEYMIVIVSGSAVASWTTNELYQKLLSERAYK